MRRLIVLVLITSLLAVGCGKSMVIDGVERKPVGLINKNVGNLTTSNYSLDVQYDVCWGNVIWGVLLIETIIAPIYFFGFSMFNPVGKMPPIPVSQ